MVTEKIVLKQVNINDQIKTFTDSAVADEDKRDLIKFIKDLRLGKVTGRPVKDETLSGYISHLQRVLEFLKKPTSTLTEKDIDDFWYSLIRDNLKYHRRDKNGKIVNSTPYADSHKVKMRNTALMYLNWKLGDNAHKITKSLRTKFRMKRKTVNFLTEAEVEKLYKSCKSVKERYIIASLFSSGARRTEWYNIRKSDYEMPSGDNPYVVLTLREEFSKTLGRTIPLYWKYAAKSIQDYLLERIEQNINPEDPVFDLNENKLKTIQMFLNRLGNRVLNKRISFHLFRKSCAFYMSKKFSGQRDKICYFFGWRFASPMPDIYIARANVIDVEFSEKIKNNDLDELRNELQNYKNLATLKDKEIKEIQEQLKNVVINSAKEMKQVRELLKLLKTKKS